MLIKNLNKRDISTLFFLTELPNMLLLRAHLCFIYIIVGALSHIQTYFNTCVLYWPGYIRSVINDKENFYYKHFIVYCCLSLFIFIFILLYINRWLILYRCHMAEKFIHYPYIIRYSTDMHLI